MQPSPDPRPDAELVLRARLGDQDCFAALLRRHFRTALAIAMAHVAQRDDAEDVCQDAFVKAHAQLERCRQPDRFGAWLAQIVRYTAINAVQRGPQRRHVSLTPALRIAASALPDAMLERAELLQRLWTALRRLRDTEREVVLLHVLDDCTHAEIARTLGISEFMSRRHLSDARRQLRQWLAPEHQPRESA